MPAPPLELLDKGVTFWQDQFRHHESRAEKLAVANAAVLALAGNSIARNLKTLSEYDGWTCPKYLAVAVVLLGLAALASSLIACILSISPGSSTGHESSPREFEEEEARERLARSAVQSSWSDSLGRTVDDNSGLIFNTKRHEYDTPDQFAARVYAYNILNFKVACSRRARLVGIAIRCCVFGVVATFLGGSFGLLTLLSG